MKITVSFLIKIGNYPLHLLSTYTVRVTFHAEIQRISLAAKMKYEVGVSHSHGYVHRVTLRYAETPSCYIKNIKLRCSILVAKLTN